MYKIRTTIIIILISINLFGCQNLSVKETNEGWELLNSKDYKGAESKFLSVLKRDPLNVEARNKLGILRYQQGRYDKAEKLFEDAYSVKQNDAGIMRNVGDAQMMQGKLEQAQKSFEKAYTQNPMIPSLYRHIHDLSYEMKTTAYWLDKFKKQSLASQEKGVPGLYLFALSEMAIQQSLFNLGQYQQALERSEIVINTLKGSETKQAGYTVPIILPFFVGVINQPGYDVDTKPMIGTMTKLHGVAHYHLGNFEQAREFLELSINTYASVSANYFLARLHLDHNDWFEAVVSSRVYLNQYNNSNGQLALVTALTREGKQDNALDLVEEYELDQLKHKAHYLRPHNFRSFEAWGDFELARNNKNEALEWYQRVVDAFPYSGRVHFLLANLYLEKGNPDVAYDHLQKASKLSPGDPRIRALMEENGLTGSSASLDRSEKDKDSVAFVIR